jgi:hypothetical protein
LWQNIEMETKAERFKWTVDTVPKWWDAIPGIMINTRTGEAHIPTAKGTIVARPGDWIIKDSWGQILTQVPDLFPDEVDLKTGTLFTLEELLNRMKERGSSVNLGWGEEGATINGTWECSWIAGGKRLLGYSTRSAFNAAYQAYSKSITVSDEAK